MFTKLPPNVSVPMFFILMTFVLLYRFLFGSVVGILLCCIALYKLSGFLFGVDPLNFDELMMWLVTQGETTKAAVLSSVITVIGFLIAYATATSNWKAQLLANMKIQAAGEIEVFFAECSRLSTDCSLYAEALVEAVDKIQKDCALDDAVFLAHYNREQSQIFIQKRQRLVSMGIDVHRIHGKYGALLLSSPGLKAELDSATKALTNIIDKVWINVPFHVQGDQNVIQTFVNQVSVVDCISLKNAVEKNSSELSFASGGLRGNLMSTVVGFNFWTIFNLYKERSDFSNTIKERFIRRQKNDL
ncbi:hypothetical protein [Cellvibrio sp. pealriver]|uniref:hypothetical protein n=1 Tax=Cellvibrio sp. pealriver TaxID=1622269 RepID=UPI00066FF622|nr:hypothetical protein [Cellvibrio sp. pealriver]